MQAVYLKLFRSELLRHEKRGGFIFVEKMLRSLEPSFQRPAFRFPLLLERARLLFLTGRWDECLQVLDQLEAHESSLEPDDRAFLYLLNARLQQGFGDLNQALSLLEIALQEAELGEGYRLVETQLEMGALFHRIGELERGNEFLRQAEAALRSTPDPRLSSRLFFEKGLVAVRDELWEEAETGFESALASLGESNPSIFRGEGLRFLGILAGLNGKPLQALKLQREALQVFFALPYPMGIAKAYNSLGQTCLSLARYEEAQFFLQKSMELCRKVGAEAELANVLGKLGLVFAKNGDFDLAISYQLQDLELCSRFGNFRALAFSLRNLGQSYLAKGDLVNAVSYLRDSRDRFAELEDAANLIKADLELVAALLEHNRLMEAFGFLEDALNLLEQRMEVTPDHVKATYFSGVVALNTENYHKAETCLWQALEMCQSLSMQSLQADVHFHLAKLYLNKEDKGAALEELLSTYRLARAHSRTKLLLQAIDLLHHLEPDSIFRELINPRF